MDNQKTFDWNDVIENESSFVLFPEGIYRFKVTGFDRERYQGSEKIPPCNKASLELTVYDEVGRSTVIRDGLFLIERMEWKLSAFFIALGLKKHGEKCPMKWNEILGREGMCKIIVDRYTRNGKEYENNKIDSYLDPAQYPLAQPKPATPSWKGGTF